MPVNYNNVKTPGEAGSEASSQVRTPMRYIQPIFRILNVRWLVLNVLVSSFQSASRRAWPVRPITFKRLYIFSRWSFPICSCWSSWPTTCGSSWPSFWAALSDTFSSAGGRAFLSILQNIAIRKIMGCLKFIMTFPLLPRINGIKCVYILSLVSWGIILLYSIQLE